MTDFRNFRLGHDLRSQLGLAPLTDAQQSRMSRLDEALRFEPKPLDPAKATPKPNILHMTVNSNDLPLDPAGQKIHDEIVRMLGRRGSVPNNIKVSHVQGTDASLIMNVDDTYTPPEKWSNPSKFAVAGTLANGGPVTLGQRIPIGISANRRAGYLDLGGNEYSINVMLSKAEAIAGVDEEGVRAAKQKFAEAFSLLTKALQDQ